MSTTKILICKEAFERLKAGKPNNSHYIGKRITASLVSKEAGFSAGYLKASNKHHKLLIEEINSFHEMKANKIQSPNLKSLKSRLRKEKENAKKYKKQRDDALEREFNLYIQIDSLTQKLAHYENITLLK